MPRPKGSKNRVSSSSRLKLAKMGCDPIERAVVCANTLFAEGDIPGAGRIYLELIQYVAPKLKAIEISQDSKNPVNFQITLGK
jgi:hypothetical protein